jgi:C4-dicarboxylate-specific signal transduction histidine kinase
MLAGQDEFSRTAQPIETFKLDELMRDTWALVCGELRAVAALEIDECICDLPQIKGNRISLVQVFSNLLINACESIQQVPARPGVIRISADVEYVDGVEMIGVEVCDNGAGIGSENIERIFERGFSTKKDGHAGLGLHWCANTLRAAGGQICAQSDEPGQGASLHVLFQREVS